MDSPRFRAAPKSLRGSDAPEGPLRNYNLWTLLDATGFAVFRLFQLELAETRLTVEQLALLRHVANGSATVREITQSTLRQQSTVSILVRRMMASGLVTKDRPPEARESRIAVTRQGVNLLRKATAASLEAAFADLWPRERDSLCGALRSLEVRARALLVPSAGPLLRYPAQTVPPEEVAPCHGPSGYELWLRLDGTRFAVSRLRELELARFGLTVEQATVLMVLHGGASLTTKDFEDITLRQHHSVSTLVARMANDGLVERHRVPGERTYRISATAEGKCLYDSVTTTAIDVAFSCLGESEKRRLAVFLFRVFTKARHLLGASHVPSLAALWSGGAVA